MKDDFICRYKETFTRQECREIIEEIEFFEETQRLFRTDKNPHLQDQKAINVNVDFLYLNKREKAAAGDVIIFPCQYTHTHRGNPPLGGTKYLATTWGWIQSNTNDTNKYE